MPKRLLLLHLQSSFAGFRGFVAKSILPDDKVDDKVAGRSAHTGLGKLLLGAVFLGLEAIS